MAKFRDCPQWTCQGKCYTKNFMWRATCWACGRDVPKGLEKKRLEALVERETSVSHAGSGTTSVTDVAEVTRVLELEGRRRAAAAIRVFVAL